MFEHDGVKEAADIGGIRIYLEYNSDRKCMELSDEYVFDGYDTRKLPGQDINLNDCEVVTGERDDIRELTRARYQLDSYGDWEAFAVKIDNHWRLGYYKDGVAVIIYYETGAYVERSSGGNYEGRVCLVARAEKSSDSEAESLVFGGYQVENLGIDYAIMGIMELTQNGEEEQLMVGRLYDDEIIQYNMIELKK